MAQSSRRVYRSLSLLAGLGGLTLLLLTVMDYGDSGSIGVNASEEIDTLRQFDSYLLEPRGTTYRLNGEVAYHWQATRANRMRNGEVLLYEPIYKGLKEGDQNWTATARKGNLS
ncbi:LPS export ABC transporter periplasmic protein LptC, partial [Litorivivens sp.]